VVLPLHEGNSNRGNLTMKRNLELLAEKLAFKEALDMDSESMVQWVADDLMKVYSDDESILEQTASNYGIDIDDWRES